MKHGVLGPNHKTMHYSGILGYERAGAIGAWIRSFEVSRPVIQAALGLTNALTRKEPVPAILLLLPAKPILQKIALVSSDPIQWACYEYEHNCNQQKGKQRRGIQY